MIQRRTRLTVADNSGAQAMTVIHIYGSSKRAFAGLGDIVQCVVKKADPVGTVKDDELVKVIIVRTHKEHRRSDGSYIRFDDNAVVIVEKTKKEPKAGRIFGPIPRELAERGYQKIISLAPEVL